MVNRIADPMEIANAVCFLLSDEASYIDGTYIKVDGGSMAMSVKIPPRVKPEENK
ncbi:MAG: SDR family oxidoreductase [Solobacterium sp.]|nr:SDR family oxidoreductase [Solobacterium sp.]